MVTSDLSTTVSEKVQGWGRTATHFSFILDLHPNSAFTSHFPSHSQAAWKYNDLTSVTQLPSFFRSVLSGLWGCTAWQTFTKLYGVTSQNTVIFIVLPWRFEVCLLVCLIVYGFFKETLSKSVYSAVLDDNWWMKLIRPSWWWAQ